MSRIALLGVFIGFVVSQARADLPVAPPPREVRPDGTRVQPPIAEPTAAEDPAAIVERIIANSKDAGERLSKTDTGTETQKKQATVLKDIDTLLNQQDDSKGGGSDKDMNPDMNPDQKKDDKKQDSKKSDMSKGMDDQLMNGNDSQPKQDRRPRQDQNGKQPKEKADKQPQDAGTNPKPDDKKDMKTDPMPGTKSSDPKEGKEPKGGPMGKTGNQPSLPVDDEVAKKVWGGPRDQMRKQVDQYYNERFMPGYSGLLKAYYSHLAAEGAKK